jgi:hypothetical protein
MEQIGSVLKDVGLLGSGAAYCFVLTEAVDDEVEGLRGCFVEV